MKDQKANGQLLRRSALAWGVSARLIIAGSLSVALWQGFFWATGQGGS